MFSRDELRKDGDDMAGFTRKFPKRQLRFILVPFEPKTPDRVGTQYTMLETDGKTEIGTLMVVGNKRTHRYSLKFKPRMPFEVVGADSVLVTLKGDEDDEKADV